MGAACFQSSLTVIVKTSPLRCSDAISFLPAQNFVELSMQVRPFPANSSPDVTPFIFIGKYHFPNTFNFKFTHVSMAVYCGRFSCLSNLSCFLPSVATKSRRLRFDLFAIGVARMTAGNVRSSKINKERIARRNGLRTATGFVVLIVSTRSDSGC